LGTATVTHPKQIIKLLENAHDNLRSDIEACLSNTEPKNHWLLRKHLVENGTQLEQIHFTFIQFWCFIYKIFTYCLEKEAMEAFLQREHIQFERVFLPSFKENERKHSKRMKISEDEFVGWRFVTGTDKQRKNIFSLAYSLSDTALYLSQQFVVQLCQEFVQRK